jgi:hypothetical protein
MYIMGVTVKTEQEEKNMCVIDIMMFVQLCVLCKLKATKTIYSPLAVKVQDVFNR